MNSSFLRIAARLCFAVIAVAFLFGLQAEGAVRVAASISNLSAIAEEIAGPLIVTETICPPDADPHAVDVLPSHAIAVSNADVFLFAGMGKDRWAESLARSAGSEELIVVDCSERVEPLEYVHEHEHSHPHDHAHEGDHTHAHEHGHSDAHYWLGPENGRLIARSIADALIRVLPDETVQIESGLAKFESRLDSSMEVWREKLKPCRGTPILTFHPGWSYFAHDLGVEIIGSIEVAHGVEPTPQELAELIQRIRSQGVRIILQEIWAPGVTAEAIARETDITVIPAATMVGGLPQTGDYFSLFSYLIEELSGACSRERTD